MLYCDCHSSSCTGTTVRRLMKDLYAEGISFLYGMLFRRMFRIKAANNLFQHEHDDSRSISIALHSRHAHSFIDGTEEIRCLNQLLPASDTSRTDCIVYMMSDRQVTLDILGERVLQRGCCNVTAQHTATIQEGEFGWKPETGSHGGPVRAWIAAAAPSAGLLI
jgi:hypothetical protein